jgi:hypothetical protein
LFLWVPAATLEISRNSFSFSFPLPNDFSFPFCFRRSQRKSSDTFQSLFRKNLIASKLSSRQNHLTDFWIHFPGFYPHTLSFPDKTKMVKKFAQGFENLSD